MIELWLILIVLAFVAAGFIVLPLLKNNRILAILFLVSLPLISFLLYLKWGNSQQLKTYYVMRAHQTEVNNALQQLNTPDKVIAALQKRLQGNPNSAQGWYLLGKLYFDLRRFSEAEQALAKANSLDANNSDYMFAYAQVLFFAHHEKLNLKAQDLLKNILQKNPDDVSANNLLAINAYLRKDYQSAIKYWEKILPQFPAESTDAKQLLSMIARAQKMLAK